MESTKKEKELSDLIADLDEDAVVSLIKQAMAKGDDPFTILDQCQKGMQLVGKRYEEGIYFISGLIMAGEIMHQVGEMVLPVLQDRIRGGDSGLILLGTVQGDIHYLGKDIVKVLLKCYGFSVNDLGVDVPPAEFLTATEESKPDIVGLSCLLNTSFKALGETISLLRTRLGDSDSFPSLVIGGLVDEEVRRHVGADHWASDAMVGVRLCQLIMKGRR
jgi:methanogenic corrinoid protein MtbC1